MGRVLVVEDEPLIAIMLHEWLTEFGYETVGPAHAVAVALSLIDATAFDCAILDFSLGREDCRPIIAALRSRSLPFALATGHSPDTFAKDYADALVLGKPYNQDSVLEIVRKMIAG